jgi:hypothetical protein
MNDFSERDTLEKLKMCELQMLLLLKKLASESPSVLKASNPELARNIEVLKEMRDVNIHQLALEGNNTTLIKAFHEPLLKKLSEDRLNLTEFELLVDSARK